jgi:hypothetical protein
MGSWVSLTVRALVPILVAACGVVAAGQDSKPVRPLHPQHAAMLRLQEGVWDLETVRAVVKALLDGGDAIAARWWLDLADAAVAENKLPAKATTVLLALRRDADARVATPQNLTVARKLLRHAESADAAKNHVECERLCLLLTALLEAVPEAQVAKSLAALRSVLGGRPRQDSDPQNLERQRRESAPTEEAALAKIRNAVRKGVVEYEAAGHRRARLALLKTIGSELTGLDAKEREALARRVWAAARQVERTKAMTVYMRGGQWVRIRRDGAPFVMKDGTDGFDSSRDEGIDFTVLEGEVIRFEPDAAKLPASAPTGMKAVKVRNCFVVGVIFDGKPAGPDLWYRIPPDDANKPDAELVAIPRGKKVKSFLSFSDSPGSVFGVPYSEAEQALEESIRNRALDPVWIGTNAKRVVIALRVPEFG